MTITEIRKKLNSYSLMAYLFLVFVIFNILDFELTYIGITHHGAHELNVVMKFFIDLFNSVWGIFWAKVIVISHIFWRYVFTEKGKEHWTLLRTKIMFGCINVLFLGVIINNTLVIF